MMQGRALKEPILFQEVRALKERILFQEDTIFIFFMLQRHGIDNNVIIIFKSDET